MKPEEMIGQAMRPIQKPQEEEKPSDTSIGSMMNNSAIAAAPVKQEASSILNIPAEALSNFNSVGQPQRPPVQQQQYRTNVGGATPPPEMDVSI